MQWNSILLPQSIHTLNNYPSPLYQMLNSNYSLLFGGHFGEYQLGGGNVRLLPLPPWPTDAAWATVWVSWLHQGCPNRVFITSTPLDTIQYVKRCQKFREVISNTSNHISITACDSEIIILVFIMLAIAN